MTNQTTTVILPSITDDELTILGDALTCLYYQVVFRSSGASRERTASILRLAEHIGVGIEGDE